jgi:hypothetical protein
MTRTAEVEINMLTSFDQDASPLDYLFQDPDYRTQDQARLDAWRNGEWHFVGICARATLKVPYGVNPQCWITSELLSPGLWGIESDSGDEYFLQVYQEEREILIGMLASLKSFKTDARLQQQGITMIIFNSRLTEPRSVYSHTVHRHVIAIIDHNGGRSVTNDVENVIDDLTRQGFDLSRYRVIYRDTRGIWDQLLIDRTGHFAGFSSINERDLSAALARLTRH